MNEETRKLIMFLLLNMDKEVRYGQSFERAQTLTPEDFTVENGVLYLDTYEGL